MGVVSGLTILAVILTLSAASLHKVAMAAVCAALGAGALIWLLALGGLDTVSQVIRAVSLHLAGQTAALPLYARETALLISALIALASFLMTIRGVGCYPALAVMLLVLMILWLDDRASLMVWAMPAVVGVVAMIAQNGHEELSLRRALPLAVIAVAVSYLLVPQSGVTSPTLKKTADDLRQKIYDYFFFTEPRSVFSLSTEGYYPQGQTQLGGKAEPTDHPVMVVSTPRRVYLRGTVMDEYTGRMWRSTTGGRRYLWISSRWSEQREALFNEALPAGKLGQTAGLMTNQEVRIKLLSDNVSTMFVPQRVRSLSPGGDLVPYFNNASEIFATRDLEAGDTYTVTAPLIQAGDAGLGTLIGACAELDDASYADVASIYTKLPDHLQQPMYDLAQKASEGAATPYEQAFAIQNYLSRNFRYTLDVEEQPENIDFVTNFLLNTHEGYCTYFASAMTVMCRMIGLPARYVEGYLATPDENGTAYVTGLQAHAWTEVYFSGFGWLTFDATPAQNNTVTPPDSSGDNNDDQDDGGESEDPPTPTPPPSDSEKQQPEQQQTPQPSSALQDGETPTPTVPPESPNQEPPDNHPPSLTWLWILLALLALGGVAARVILTMPDKRAARRKDAEGRFMVWVQAVHDELRVMKLPRTASESPMAYMKRLDGLHRLPVELLPLGECMALVFYGKLPPEPEEIDMARDAYQRLLPQLTLLMKVRLFASRAFLPPRKTDFTKP